MKSTAVYIKYLYCTRSINSILSYKSVCATYTTYLIYAFNRNFIFYFRRKKREKKDALHFEKVLIHRFACANKILLGKLRLNSTFMKNFSLLLFVQFILINIGMAMPCQSEFLRNVIHCAIQIFITMNVCDPSNTFY